MVVSRLPYFHGPINESSGSGYQALLHVQEGPGDEARTHTSLIIGTKLI